MKNKTFHYKDLLIELHPEVYEPSEDTFQLLEAISVNANDRILEIGTGCGLIALVCAKKGAAVVCTDINPFAVEIAKKNYVKNKVLLKGSIEIRQGELFTVINDDEMFDTVIFNPPYLPTKLEERIGGSGWFDIAVDGGIDGLNVTKQFINGLHKHLKKNGRAYFVFSSLSDRDKLDNYISESGLSSEIMLSRRYNDEQIDIYCTSIN